MRPTLYHNPRCSKSRAAKQILDTTGTAYDTVLYLENPPGKDTLLRIARALEHPRTLLRMKEARAAGGRDTDDADDPETVAAFLAAHPHAMERPVIVTGTHAIVARPPERIHDIL
jgi:arsenate reductase (glutaredoxin)